VNLPLRVLVRKLDGVNITTGTNTDRPELATGRQKINLYLLSTRPSCIPHPLDTLTLLILSGQRYGPSDGNCADDSLYRSHTAILFVRVLVLIAVRALPPNYNRRFVY
jgi:hypothetical protein